MQKLEVPAPSDIKKWRQRLKLTQAELARLANVSQPLITRIEHGDIDPRMSTFQSIINALNAVEHSEVTAKSLMSSPVVTVSPDDNINDISRLMIDQGFSQLPVINNGTPVGTISDKCIIRDSVSTNSLSDVGRKTAKDIMDANLPMVNLQTSVTHISKILEEKPAVLVVDRGGVQGIITKADLIKMIKV